MKICMKPDCDYQVRHGPISDSVYCPACGSELTPAPTTGTVVHGPGRSFEIPEQAPRGLRIGAGLIDLLIGMAIFLVGLVPGINVISSLLDTAFWLLRDIKGASPGKSLFGLEVRTHGGGKPTQAALMLRNLPFTPLIIQIIPVIGSLLAPLVIFVLIAEFLLIVLANRRIGDFLAGTIVVKKGTIGTRVNTARSGY